MPVLVCFGQNAPRPAAWAEPNRAELAGTHHRTFQSSLAKSEVSYQIYLPPDYEAGAPRRYPVVYWLHGLNGDRRGGMPFVRHLDAFIRDGKAPAMIVVLANGIASTTTHPTEHGPSRA